MIEFNAPDIDPAKQPFAQAVPSPAVQKWLTEMVQMCQPDRIRVLTGDAHERQLLLDQAVAEKVLIRLNQEKLPGCYLHRSAPHDVARTEECTFICTPSETLAGPNNHWKEPRQAYAQLRGQFTGAMHGRTMYVVPFVMGPLGSPFAMVGIELTDSIYVAISMGIMTRMGSVTWPELEKKGDIFTHCLHSVGDLRPEQRNICHFPVDDTVWSFGSGYGGNALLGKKCMALRLASFAGYREGWMAEHMMLMGVTSPQGEKTYIAGAFPSSCGKTNFAMLIPPEKYRQAGWKVTTVGDDIVWMHVNAKGRLYAINPEAGYFGVVPGTNPRTNANAMKIISHDTIYTNVGLLPDGDVWWEGKTDEPPSDCLDWTGQPWKPGCGRPVAHPNSRFTAPMTNNPVLDPSANDPDGVPVSGIIFGGRRSKSVPLIYQAFNWIHGVYMGATLGSETTAAAAGQVGVVRNDPMAMLPFCGYNLNNYFAHWIRMRKKMKDCPRIFHVNWFRKDDEGHYLWPGFSENMRILKWIIDRCQGRAYAAETILGWMPRPQDIDLEGLNIGTKQIEAVQDVDIESLKREILVHGELSMKLAGDMPKELIFLRELLVARL